MLLTESQLRNVIRKIIVKESRVERKLAMKNVKSQEEEHAEKLATLISTGDLENIRQAMEIAETISALEEYKEKPMYLASGGEPYAEEVYRYKFTGLATNTFKEALDRHLQGNRNLSHYIAFHSYKFKGMWEISFYAFPE